MLHSDLKPVQSAENSGDWIKIKKKKKKPYHKRVKLSGFVVFNIIKQKSYKSM